MGVAQTWIECAGEPEAFLEGIELARMGGMYIVAGVFSERGSIGISPHRHVLAKNLRIIGIRNHPYTVYGPAMELMRKWRDRFPWTRIVTDRFPVVEAAAAMVRSFDLETMKVVIGPRATAQLILFRETKEPVTWRFDEGGDDVWESDVSYYSRAHINQTQNFVDCVLTG